MLGDVIERAYTLEELALVELGFAQQQPGFGHGWIELLLLEPLAVSGVSRSFRVGLGALLDAMQFDALAALLNGAVHFAFGGFRGFVVADRIEVEQGRVVVFVGACNVLQALFEGRIAVVIDVVVDLHGMIGTAGPRVLLCGTRRHQQCQQQKYVTTTFHLHKLVFGLLEIDFSGPQYRRGEVRAVGRVGEVLCLQTNGSLHIVLAA